jgi:hypothetical protein
MAGLEILGVVKDYFVTHLNGEKIKGNAVDLTCGQTRTCISSRKRCDYLECRAISLRSSLAKGICVECSTLMYGFRVHVSSSCKCHVVVNSGLDPSVSQDICTSHDRVVFKRIVYLGTGTTSTKLKIPFTTSVK